MNNGKSRVKLEMDNTLNIFFSVCARKYFQGSKKSQTFQKNQHFTEWTAFKSESLFSIKNITYTSWYINFSFVLHYFVFCSIRLLKALKYKLPGYGKIFTATWFQQLKVNANIAIILHNLCDCKVVIRNRFLKRAASFSVISVRFDF